MVRDGLPFRGGYVHYGRQRDGTIIAVRSMPIEGAEPAAVPGEVVAAETAAGVGVTAVRSANLTELNTNPGAIVTVRAEGIL